MGSAEAQGSLWGVGAREWAELAEPAHIPFYEAAFDAMPLAEGMDLLDAGCGSGLALVLAQQRGARPTGLDASAGLLAVAAERLPQADLRQGDLEELPFGSGSFDAVTAFNSVQFAADPVRALAELRRVARPGAPVAVTVWGAPEQCDIRAAFGAIGSVLPPPPPGAAGPFALSAPGMLESLAESAGLAPERGIDVPTPYVYPDLEAGARVLLSSGPGRRAVDHAGEETARAALSAAFASFRQDDGSFRFSNVFRVVVARA